jgi:hypothetical protein
MKFTLDLSSDDNFLVCDSCGNEDFVLRRGKKLSSDKKYKDFLFFECPNCNGAGFWTTRQSIDNDRQLARALSRCKAQQSAGCGKNASSTKQSSGAPV